MAVLSALLVFLAPWLRAASWFSQIGWVNLFGDPQWAPRVAAPHVGVAPLLTGTLLTAGIAITIAAALSGLAAIFLSELCPSRLRRLLQPVLVLSSAVPTVALGFAGLAVVTPALQALWPDLAGQSALAAGLVMGVMMVPMLSLLWDRSLRAVPRALRDAADGLGATRLRTLAVVVIPSASPRLSAALVLTLGRAMGETIIVSMVAGHRPVLGFDPTATVETLSSWMLRASLTGAADTSAGLGSLAGVGALLMTLTLACQAGARLFFAREAAL